MNVKVVTFLVAIMLQKHSVLLHAQDGTVNRTKRLLPGTYDCNPTLNQCRKGDWVDDNIADCYYDSSILKWNCDAVGGSIFSWVVGPDVDDKCKPVSGLDISCGEQGTNTRCVCSDYKIQLDTCVCQYWTEEKPGENEPAFCTAYYLGGITGVHQWGCCNNCNDETQNTCDGVTYQGGSTVTYCGQCGENIAANKGQVKYSFNCGSCDIQTECQKRCDDTLLYRLPGLCWKWIDCFYGCCLKAVPQSNKKRSVRITSQQVSSLEFCGDGDCTGHETTTSCPEDCCNPADCSNELSQCTSTCCECCVTSGISLNTLTSL